MSYHYRKNQESKLQQYNDLTKELYSDINNLEKLKLEAEFYQEKNKPIARHSIDNKSSALADQIMNELIGNPSLPNRYPQKKAAQKIPQYYPEARVAEVYKDPRGQVERQNNFINERELQKNKLQNQKHEGLFPNSSDRNKIRSFGKQPQPIPESDHQNPSVNKPNSPAKPHNYNPQFNPFVKDEEDEKKRKQEKNRQYLRALQEQRVEQQRKRQAEVKEEKKRKENVYHDYMPSNKIQQKPLVMKKSDPNSKPPKIQINAGNNNRFDKGLIRSKAIEIKHKFHKGKIIYEEYERQINNLRKHYDGNLEELLEENSSNKMDKQQLPPEIEVAELPRVQEQGKVSNNNEDQHRNEPNNRTTPYPVRNDSANYSQFMANNLNQPQSYYQNATLSPNMGPYPSPPQSSPNISAEYLDMMKKMFEVCIRQVKQAYQNNNQGQVYQELMSKVIAGTQNNFLPQQPPIHISQQRQFFSDSKQHREYFQKVSNFKKNNPTPDSIPFGQSENSEYYDKSLSGIASKIPLSVGAAKKQGKGMGLDEFYNRKYKIKKLQKFAILIDPNQSQLEIPSTSTYLRPKNAKQERDRRCQDDLIQLRNLQTQNRVAELAKKINKNSVYVAERRVLKQTNASPVKGANPQPVQIYKRQKSLQNPFLKKHVSAEDNLMTFNERDLKPNSPMNKYSPKSKKEILEQDEYQTEPKREQPKVAANFYLQYENKINIPATKMLDFVNVHTQELKVKQQGADNGERSVTVKQGSLAKVSSKDYFSNNQISPVKQSDNYYEQSLETIKSDYASAKFSPKPIKALDVPKDRRPSQQFNGSERQRLQLQQLQQDMIGYSQTVESIEESNEKRPPLSKKRSIGKKKESSIARSKMMGDSASRSYNNNQSDVQLSPAKFDSNIYESQYDESVNEIKPMNVNPQMVKNNLKQHREESQIQISPPVIVEPRSAVNFYEVTPMEEIRSKSSKSIAQGKLKSLEEARKLAKQCRVKTVEQNKDYRSVQEKFWQLESFLTKKDESVLSIKRQANPPQQKEKTPGKAKKNIMKLLDELDIDEEEYRQDFQSYREESERYI